MLFSPLHLLTVPTVLNSPRHSCIKKSWISPADNEGKRDENKTGGEYCPAYSNISMCIIRKSKVQASDVPNKNDGRFVSNEVDFSLNYYI